MHTHTHTHTHTHAHGAAGRQWLNQHARRHNNWHAERDWRAEQRAGCYGTYTPSSTDIGQGAGGVEEAPDVSAVYAGPLMEF